MVFFYSNPDLIENKSDETEKALFYIQVSIYPKSSYKTLKEKQAQGDASVYELAEFKDSQGRLWVSSGPVWSQGDSSNYTVETNYKDKYYHISSQAYGKNLEKYLKKELIIQNGNSYDVTPLLEEHAKLIKNILSTFEFTN